MQVRCEVRTETTEGNTEEFNRNESLNITRKSWIINRITIVRNSSDVFFLKLEQVRCYFSMTFSLDFMCSSFVLLVFLHSLTCFYIFFSHRNHLFRLNLEDLTLIQVSVKIVLVPLPDSAGSPRESLFDLSARIADSEPKLRLLSTNSWVGYHTLLTAFTT